MKSTALRYFILSFIIILFCSSLNAQKFEGILTYQIKYTPKSEEVKIKDLELQYGNKEIVSISNAFYKTERQYNDELLKTSIYDNATRTNIIKHKQSEFRIKDVISSDIAAKLIKSEVDAKVGDYACQVYSFEKTALKVTFYISKETYAGNNPANSWYIYPTSFMGPVVRLVVANPDYTMVQDLVGVESKSLDKSIFEGGDELVAVPEDELSQGLLTPEKRRELIQCMYRSIGYPGFLQLQNIEGKIVAELLIDQKGQVKHIQIRAEYFKKQEEIIRIYQARKIASLEKKINKKVLPKLECCVAGFSFVAPMSAGVSVNTLLRIPFIFSKNAADVAEENPDLDDLETDEMYFDDFDDFY